MKRWIVTFTDKDECRYASSHVCQAESIRGAVAQFEKGNFSVVTERFKGKADTHRGWAYSETRNYLVEQL